MIISFGWDHPYRVWVRRRSKILRTAFTDLLFDPRPALSIPETSTRRSPKLVRVIIV